MGEERGALAARFDGKYLSLTSYRRDGSAVATPVWYVVENGRLLIATDPDSYKVKRIRRNPAVEIARCTGTGKLLSDPIPARAELLPEREVERVERLMARKYRLDRVLVLPLYRAVQRLRGSPRRTAKTVIVAITPT